MCEQSEITPRCGLARMQLFFRLYLRTHFNKRVLPDARLRFGKKFLNCCFDGAVSLKAVPPSNWGVPLKELMILTRLF